LRCLFDEKDFADFRHQEEKKACAATARASRDGFEIDATDSSSEIVRIRSRVHERQHPGFLG
jgi:hypothetical protein